MKAKLFPFLVLSIIFCLLLLQSCGPVDDNDDDGDPCADVIDKYYLSKEDKAQVPYTGFDTINMVSNMGDTIHCIGTGKQFFTTRRFELHGNPACGNHGVESLYEAYKIEYVDSLKNLTIAISQFGHYPDEPYEGFPLVLYRFKQKNFFIAIYSISSAEANSYVGDITIGNSTYKKVNRAYNEMNDSSVFALVNKTNGLIQFKLSQTEIWSLLN